MRVERMIPFDMCMLRQFRFLTYSLRCFSAQYALQKRAGALLLNACQQLAFVRRRRLESSSQIFRQEFFRSSVKCHVVSRPRKAVPFVGKNVILYRLIVLAHSSYNLIALRFVYTRIVGALANE